MKLNFFKSELKKDIDSISKNAHFKEFLFHSFLKSMLFEKGDFNKNSQEYYEFKNRFIDLLKTLKDNNFLFDIRFSMDNLNRICLKYNSQNIIFISLGPIFGEYFDEEKIVYFSALFKVQDIQNMKIDIKNFYFVSNDIKVLYLTN